MKRILCPVDFSNASLNAIEFSVQLAAQHNAHISLFHVFTEEEFNQALKVSKLNEKDYTDQEYENHHQRAEAIIASLVKEILSSSNGKYTADYLVSDGVLEDEIVDYTNDNDYDFVVMGTQGVNNSREAFFGSSTVQVMQQVDVPLMCVPEEATFSTLNHWVYASNYHTKDEEALAQLIHLAQPFGAQITMLHVYEEDKGTQQVDLMQHVTRLKGNLNYNKLQFVNIKGKENAHGIHEAFQEVKGDVLALHSKKRTMLNSIMEGSLAKQLTYFAHYPLLIFK